jgi:D-3-phosphoglycerate dehydrogenase
MGKKPPLRVLIADGLAPEGLALLQRAKGVAVDLRPDITPKQLRSVVRRYDALLVRSRTKVTKEIIAAGERLQLIGRAGVGVDNIDVDAASKHGILVMNTPEGNTLSTAELTVALMLALSRRIPEAASLARAGQWHKLMGCELAGKTVGIIGLGRIGGTVAKRCAAFGMRVLGYDPFVAQDRSRMADVNLVPLARLLRESDFITVHTPLDDKTYHMIGAREFAEMKSGVRVLNCARGGIVDEQALQGALQSGKVSGAALDVFENEPPADSPLLKLPNVIPTPHIGASTEEAQANVSIQIAEQTLAALSGGPIRNAVNIPPIEPEVYAIIGPYISLAEKLGRFVAQLAEGRIGRIRITCYGEMNEYNATPITNALLKGLLDPHLEGTVNYISAAALARERGLAVSQLKSSESADFTNLITVEMQLGRKTLSVAGSYFGRHDPRIVRINGHHVDVEPRGHLLVVTNKDRPGVISHLSTIVARHKINIANMTVGRNRPFGKAVIVLNLDSALDRRALSEIARSDLIIEARQVEL